jgi:hypothetical protein
VCLHVFIQALCARLNIYKKEFEDLRQMGYAKNKYIEDQERGYSSGSDVFICQKHFGDDDIERYIQNLGTFENECSFCNDDDKEEPSVTINSDVLLSGILACIFRSYDHPANGLAYESAEGGYQGDVYGTLELLNEIIPLDADYEVLEYLAHEIIQAEWTEGEFYGNSYSEELSYLWNNFSYLIKHKVRYLFKEIEPNQHEDGPQNESYSILESIGNSIIKLNLFVNIPEKTNLFDQDVVIYRARQHGSTEEVKSCKHIGSPPSEKASSSRFSAEGISMFYGAENEKTAIEEIINRDEPTDIISIAEFYPAAELTLIDLRNINKIGFFNFEAVDLYEPSRFLSTFVHQVSIKLDKNQNRRIEFVPSQVVTEYFRHVLPSKAGIPIKIIYKSAQNKGCDCYVIFADNEQCKDEEDVDDRTVMIFRKLEVMKVSDL